MRAAALVALVVFWVSLAAPFDYDLWFDIRMGEEIARTHSIPHLDASFLPAAPQLGSHYTPNDEWAFCLGVYGVYRVGGLVGLAVAKSILLAALFGLLYRGCRLYLPPWASLLWTAFGYQLMASRFMLRPQLATDLCLAVLVTALLAGGSRLRPWMGFALFVVWANLHAGFMIGLVILFGWTLLELLRLPRTRPGVSARLTSLWFLGGALAPFFTPGGWRLYRYVFDHFVTRSSDMDVIAEWTAAPADWYLRPLGLFALVALVGFGLALRRGDLRLPYLGVCGLLFLLTLQHNRAVGELVAGGLPLAVSGWRLPSRRALDALVAVGLVLLLVRLPGDLEGRQLYPEGALQELRRRGYQGVIFNAYHFGGWLVFQHERPFIHGMTSKYPLPLLDEYMTILKDPSRMRQFGVGAILLHYPAYVDVHTAFMEKLSGWSLVYFDDLCLLYLPSPQPDAYTALQPALAQPFVGGLEEADRELARKLKQDANCAVAWRLLAQLRLRQGRAQEAEQTYREMSRRFPSDSAGALGLGALLYQQGKLEPAVEQLRQAVALSPGSATARFDLALALAAQLREAARAGQDTRALRDQAWRAAQEALPYEKEIPGIRPLYEQLKALR